MPRKNKNNSIAESAARGGMSAVMPYVALAGVAYLGYKAISGINFGGAAAGIADGIKERITETINNTTEKITETTKRVVDTIYYGGEVGLEVPNSSDEPIILPDGTTMGPIPGSTKYVKKNIQGDYFGLSGPVLIDSRTATGTGWNETSQIMPDLTGIMDGTVTILDSKYNKDLIAAQIEKYGIPNINTEAVPKSSTKKSSTKTPTGPTLTDSEVAALKSLGKKPVTKPNTTGKIRVLSRPDKFGNRYDVTDISISRVR